MSEKLTFGRKIALGTTLAVGGLSLAGCAGDSVTETFTYAVDCEGGDINIIETGVLAVDTATIIFDCEGKAPASLNLVEGDSTTVIEPENGDETIALEVRNISGSMGYSTDLNSSTAINETTSNATIRISGANEINSVVVGDQIKSTQE